MAALKVLEYWWPRPHTVMCHEFLEVLECTVITVMRFRDCFKLGAFMVFFGGNVWAAVAVGGHWPLLVVSADCHWWAGQL